MDERRALVLGLASVLLWSTVATAFKITLQQLTPLQMVTVASAVSSAVLLIICGVTGKLAQVSRQFYAAPLYYLCMGLINPLAYYLILFKAYALLPASQAQAINYSWAITLTVMAALFLGQRITKKDWIAAFISYFGVVIIATQGQLLHLHVTSLTGVGLALLSTLLWAGYWILNTKKTADPIVSVLLGFLIALPICIILCLYSDTSWSGVTWTGWAAVSYVGLFEMGITFVLWLTALKNTKNTAKISNLIFISPFISLILLATIIGETIHISTLFGLIMIVGGLLVQQTKRKNKKTTDTSI
ncbi:DMT family transporter [Vibrio palustris]|uniref:Aromatic amino acid exporter n=1 Tax=Vibrio palustris TaxID=1918946 RepID=A0A1R4B806_9VIBR|nr:DMT family transporter [Vibrio palustris]SJL85055.1 aromatic amino acid exporter [Vibrio palustris]